MGLEAFYQGQCRVLERVAGGGTLGESLEAIVRLIERFGSDMSCTIMLLDDTGTRIRTGAAPSLPPGYMQAIDGQPIGAKAGSCGAAAHLGRTVVVEDIATHPNWADYRDVALRYGLCACWSTPIISDGKVLGTFAMYYREPRGPSDHDRQLVDAAIHLAATAIVHDRTIRALREREERAVTVANALRKSEERLRAVIEHTPNVAIQWYDDVGRITFCNRASLDLFGWNANAVIGKTLEDIRFFTPDEEKKFATLRALAKAGTPSPPIEFSYRRPDGSNGSVLSTVFRIPLGTDETCIVCMDVDLTDHHRMQEAIRASEALQATIYAKVIDPIFYVAVEGEDRYRFVSVNPAFLLTAGVPESYVVGRELSEVIPEPSYSHVRERYREAINSRREVRWEELTPFRTGVRSSMISISPIFDANGGCTIIGTVRDITDLRRAEAERRTIEMQLQQSQRLQSLGTLASGIAHDFNNVLAAISSNAALALESDLPPNDIRDCITDIQHATQRATQLVRQILSFARKQDVRKERGDVRLVIDEAITLVRRAVATRSHITVRLPPTALETMFDPTQLHQVLVNLVTNAVHANASEIEVRADLYEHTGSTAPIDLPEGPCIQISVTDSGVGMDEATLARIFDPFFTTKSADEGTGLGLSIVHEIVRGHGGAITVRSRVGQGTTFDVYLPRSADERATATPGKGERVMLVDDEQAIVFLGKRILTKLGYCVTAHDNPHRALEEFRANPSGFDAVISDLAMPGMTGITFLTAVRELRPDIAVILTSNYALAADIESARERGLGDVIPKPHTLDEFAWTLSHRLQERVPK